MSDFLSVLSIYKSSELVIKNERYKDMIINSKRKKNHIE
jgi:hypothetical protein